MAERPASRLPFWALVVELARPLVLVALFVLAWHNRWCVPGVALALASVFASSILVHDLIHGALGLPRAVNEVALSVAALLLVKSGHGLRALHLAHHRHCLDDHDVEGGVAHATFGSLLVRGPLLAVVARADAFRAEPRTRTVQVLETTLNAAMLVSAAVVLVATGSTALLTYWGCVVLVTVSAPIWGAKVPHMVPWRHPVVRKLARLTGRFTPATASVLLHELHHRFPRVPVSLLPVNAHLLDTTQPSRCREVAR